MQYHYLINNRTPLRALGYRATPSSPRCLLPDVRHPPSTPRNTSASSTPTGSGRRPPKAEVAPSPHHLLPSVPPPSSSYGRQRQIPQQTPNPNLDHAAATTRTKPPSGEAAGASHRPRLCHRFPLPPPLRSPTPRPRIRLVDGRLPSRGGGRAVGLRCDRPRGILSVDNTALLL
jgi:hypothetical protein